MTDHIKDQLCARIEELEAEKMELNEQLDIAQQEAAKARREKIILKETFSAEIQKAVKRARRDWASHASDEMKAQWQARHEWDWGDGEGERCVKCGDKDWMAGPVCSEAKLRHQAEGGET